jgi:heme exporter protein A
MNTAAEGLGVEGVHVWRGDRHVLKNLSFEINPREALHISGRNGSGKTTLLKVACGLLRPEQGRVTWRGRSISEVRADYQHALAYASHEPALKGDLTALENLRFMVGLKRRSSAAELAGCLQRTGVAGCADLPVRVLSAGQRRRVAMARVLGMRAPLWLLDEPFTNLDAAGSEIFAALIAEHVSSGGMAVVVAHHELVLPTAACRLELPG